MLGSNILYLFLNALRRVGNTSISYVVYRVGKIRLTVVHMKNNAIILNNNTRQNVSCPQYCKPPFAPSCMWYITVHCLQRIHYLISSSFSFISCKIHR